MYQHKSVNDQHISLHDCRAERILFKDDILTFEFPNGYWVLPDHPENISKEVVRTDAAKIEFQIIDEVLDGIDFHFFKVTRGGKVIREKWEIQNFINAVNNGEYQIEFVDEYKGYQSHLYKCYVWFDKKPYCYECEIVLRSENITYLWNNLQN